VKHAPQISKDPFIFEIPSGKEFRITAVDAIGRKSATDILLG